MIEFGGQNKPCSNSHALGGGCGGGQFAIVLGQEAKYFDCGLFNPKVNYHHARTRSEIGFCDKAPIGVMAPRQPEKSPGSTIPHFHPYLPPGQASKAAGLLTDP